MPDFSQQPIIDTHLHLWNIHKLDLPWLSSAPPILNRTYDAADFQSAASEVNLRQAIYMEVDVRPDREMQRKEALRAIELFQDPTNRVTAAIIGGSPEQPDFGTYIAEFANHACVKGVRSVLHTTAAPPGMCLLPTFEQSMRELGNLGLSFDLCVRCDEMLIIEKLIARAPNTQFILDHCGGIGGQTPTDIRKNLWEEGIRAFANHENVVCKISGIVDDQLPTDWTPDRLSERVLYCIDMFGEDRVLFGGDWPVCLLGGSYTQWVSALYDIVQDHGDHLTQKLFHDNALRVYRLDSDI